MRTGEKIKERKTEKATEKKIQSLKKIRKTNRRCVHGYSLCLLEGKFDRIFTKFSLS